jgi:hypothetical protein
LTLRIPEWCWFGPPATLTVNGEAVGGVPLTAGKLARIEREWKPGDTVRLTLPMPLAAHGWGANGAVSVIRGPLTFSLKIAEKDVRHGGTDAWPARDLFPASPWNYGLVIGPKLRESLVVQEGPWPADDRPFVNPPVTIRATAKRIPNWTLDPRGLVREVVPGPIRSSEPTETVTLVPMGAARLRISAFPLIGDGPDARDWPPAPTPLYKASASHCFENDTVDALCDGVLPKDSADHSIDRFTWWPRKGSAEWVQYDFPRPRTVDRADVYWFVDHPRGGCKLPKSWRLLYRDGGAWKPVAEPTGYPTRSSEFCEVRFKPVTTDALRLGVQLESGFSGGILEWRVGPR